MVYGSYGVLMSLSKVNNNIPFSSSALNFFIETVKVGRPVPCTEFRRLDKHIECFFIRGDTFVCAQEKSSYMCFYVIILCRLKIQLIHLTAC